MAPMVTELPGERIERYRRDGLVYPIETFGPIEAFGQKTRRIILA
jgi:hypothetical protein